MVLGGWIVGWVDGGWMGGNASLRIAYINQKLSTTFLSNCFQILNIDSTNVFQVSNEELLQSKIEIEIPQSINENPKLPNYLT